MAQLYQNSKNGQVVEFIGHHDKSWAMVKNQSGEVSYVSVDNLVEWEEGKGKTQRVAKPQKTLQAKKKDEADPKSPTIPPETRININLATQQALTQHIKGLGHSSAKQVIELRSSLPGERFTTWDQLRQVKRVNWDAVIDSDVAWIG